jgi:hypothetical protein
VSREIALERERRDGRCHLAVGLAPMPWDTQCSPRRTAIMTMDAVGIGKLVLLAVALVLMLSMTGCAATGPAAPLSNHGMDYYPSFNPLDPGP